MPLRTSGDRSAQRAAKPSPAGTDTVASWPPRRLLTHGPLRISLVTVLLLLAIVAGAARAQVAATPVPRLMTTAVEGPMALGAGSVLYVDDWSRLEARTGHWLAFDRSGVRDPAWPDVDGRVRVSVSDGAGGWFIAGEFEHVAGRPRAHLAHVSARGTLDPTWSPAADGAVWALTVVGDTVYVGGEFESIDRHPRARLAALDRVTGQVRPWKPQVDYTVQALAYAGGVIYVGGEFSRSGRAVRRGLAAFAADSGALTAWAPRLKGSESIGTAVEALAVAGGRLYMAGDFVAVDGRERRSLAAFDAATGALTPWDPKADYAGADVLAVAGGAVYVGGIFDRIGGAPRSGLAALDATTGQALPWRADLGQGSGVAFVSAITVDGDRVYVGGEFEVIGGQPRSNLAMLDATTGVPSSWNPRPDQAVFSLAVSDSQLVVGGDFHGVDLHVGDGLAGIDLDTGTMRPVTAGVRGVGDDRVDVTALAADGQTVFAAGACRGRGCHRRRYLARIDAPTGATRRWNRLTASSGAYNALAVHGRRLYVGGWFHRIGGRKRENIAAIDTRTGRVTRWRADTNGSVNLLVVHGHTLYVAGTFTRVNGHRRRRVAAFDLRTGRLTAWNPDVDRWGVQAIAVSGERVYLGGDFERVGARRRAWLAAVSRRDGRLEPWRPRLNGVVTGLVVIDHTVYVSGALSKVNGEPRESIAAISSVTGAARKWNPTVEGDEVFALHATPAGLLASGSFAALGGVAGGPAPGLFLFPPGR